MKQEFLPIPLSGSQRKRYKYVTLWTDGYFYEARIEKVMPAIRSTMVAGMVAITNEEVYAHFSYLHRTGYDNLVFGYEPKPAYGTRGFLNAALHLDRLYSICMLFVQCGQCGQI